MAARTDLLLDSDGDLPIDFVGLMPIGYSDKQHIKDNFQSFPGEWKQFPTSGIGVGRYLKASGAAILTLKNNARQGLQSDGYKVANMKIGFDGSNRMVIHPNAYR